MADQIKDGGPAFPRDSYKDSETGLIVQQNGMSLRDRIAIAALPSAVEDYGQPATGHNKGQRTDRGSPVLPWANPAIGTREEIIARQAYRYADAMLKARGC